MGFDIWTGIQLIQCIISGPQRNTQIVHCIGISLFCICSSLINSNEHYRNQSSCSLVCFQSLTFSSRFWVLWPCCVSFTLCTSWYLSSIFVLPLSELVVLGPEYISCPPHFWPLNTAVLLGDSLTHTSAHPMVSNVFVTHKTGARQVQLKPCPCHIKVILSAQACAALKLNHYEKSWWSKEDLDDLWKSLNDVTKTIASKHHKSVRCIQNELYLDHTKFRSRCNKINSWNVYCWKQWHIDCAANESDENGILFFCLFQAWIAYLKTLQQLVASLCYAV